MRSSTSRTSVPCGSTATSRSTTSIDISTSAYRARAAKRVPAAGTTAIGSTRTFLGGTTPTGLRINFAPVGTAILWAPFYVATDAGVRIARALGSDVPADGFSRPYIAAVAYASAVYGFLALLLAGRIAHRLTGAGIGPVLAVWLGTPLLFYMYIAPGFSHAASAFIVAVFVAVWCKFRREWPRRSCRTWGLAA